MHEAILWLAFLAIVGTCIYLHPPAGLMVAGAGVFWILRVLNRDEQ